LAIRFPRAAADEYQLAIVWPVGIEFEKVLDLCRLAVFVNTKQADVEIADEKGHLLLRGKDQPYVIVAFVSVEVVRPALVECDDIRPQSGFIFAFLFNCSNGRTARGGSLITCHARFYCAGDTRGYVLDGHQHVQL
jgi:hypothetical protein